MLLPSHDGLGRQGADVASPGRPCRSRSPATSLPLARVFVNVVRLFGDGQRRDPRHAGQVGQRQIVLRMIGFGRDDPDLAKAAFAVLLAQRAASSSCVFCVHLSFSVSNLLTSNGKYG